MGECERREEAGWEHRWVVQSAESTTRLQGKSEDVEKDGSTIVVGGLEF